MLLESQDKANNSNSNSNNNNKELVTVFLDMTTTMLTFITNMNTLSRWMEMSNLDTQELLAIYTLALLEHNQ